MRNTVSCGGTNKIMVGYLGIGQGSATFNYREN